MKNDYGELSGAVEHKRWSKLRELILAGARDDPSRYGFKDYPLIFPVLYEKREELACLWLDHGYDPETTGGRFRHGIAHVAATCNLPLVLKKLDSLGADLERENDLGETPLKRAAEAGNAECVKALLEAGLDPDGGLEPGGQGETALAVAANAACARLLLAAGASLAIASYGFEDMPKRVALRFKLRDEKLLPLSAAALGGRAEALEAMLEAGADPDCANGQPLRMAAMCHKIEARSCINMLLNAGAKIDGIPGKAPLLLAAFGGNRKVCEALLEAGASPLPEALELAAESGSWACLESLRLRGIGDPGQALRAAARAGKEYNMFHLGQFGSNTYRLALHGAIEGCNFPLALSLCEWDDVADAPDENGMTPLIKLYSLDRRRETWRFVKDGKTFEEREDFNVNPFFMPANWNELLYKFEEDVMEIARKLLAKGARLDARDNAGRSPLWHAAHGSWLKSIPWLISLGASLDERDKQGISAFEAGCMSGEILTLKPMLESAYNINTWDAKGNTPLLKLALRNEKHTYSMIGWLLDKGADPDLPNAKGQTFRKLLAQNRELEEYLRCYFSDLSF